MDLKFKVGDIIASNQNLLTYYNNVIRGYKNLKACFVRNGEDTDLMLVKISTDKLINSMVVSMWPDEENPIYIQLLVKEQALWFFVEDFILYGFEKLSPK